MNRLARTRYGPFSLGKVRAGGVARVEIPKAFLRRLEEGTAGGSLGAGGGGSGRRRAEGPGPGTGKRREAEAGGMSSLRQGGSFSRGEGTDSRSRGGGGEGGDGRGTYSGGGGARSVGGTWGRAKGKKGARIRKGVGAPMSRGDNSMRSWEQQRAR